MQIKSLSLQNFRNYKENSFEFADGLNIIYGENGKGKTNLVEAVYLMNHSKSFRSRIDKNMITIGEKTSFIKGEFSDLHSAHTIDIRLDRFAPKAINVDLFPIERISDMIGLCNIALFTPEDIALVSEGPSVRRAFMNREISQTKPAYYPLISRYDAVITNKNIVLKQEQPDLIMLDVYDEELSALAEKIMNYRRDFVQKLSVHAASMHQMISDGKEKLEVEYRPSLHTEDKASILNEFAQSRGKDISNGFASLGVHKDEIYISLSGKHLREYGSQGQKKTAAISLTLSQIPLIKAEKDEYPIIILDDIYSMLDKKRRQILTEIFNDMQVFITSTDRMDFEGANYIAL